MVLATLLSLVSAAADASIAYIVKPMMDGIFVSKNKDLLYIIPVALVALYVLKSALRFGLSFTYRFVGTKVVQAFRSQLYAKIIYLPVKFFSDTTTGTLMSRITNDVNAIQMSIPSMITIFKDVVTIACLTGVILTMNAKMAIVAILIYPIFIHPMVLLGRKMRQYSRSTMEHMADLTSNLQETFSGIRVVKAFAQEKREINKFENTNENVTRYSIKASAASEATSPLMEAVSSLGIAAILFYGGLQVINGNSTPGEFFSFLAALVMVYEPVKKVGGAYNSVQTAVASAKRVFDVLETQNDILGNDGTEPCNAQGQKVSFNGVCFKYGDGEPYVLDNVSFTAEPGMTVAFVGHSGAGKSTIANLLPRFYDINDGSICIGDMDIREFKVHSLRENIGYVTQEAFLFNDTIINNVSYDGKEHTLQDVMEACRAAYAHDFIQNLPAGYDTVIGERGVRLSGGQKQRITIARALLKNPPILILDEATSALDTESEREVQHALDNLMVGRTSFVIAHRLSTVINADMIVVLDKGRIIAAGTHDELIKTSAHYRNLYNTQKNISDDY